MQMVADLPGVGWRILGMPVGAGAIPRIGLSIGVFPESHSLGPAA